MTQNYLVFAAVDPADLPVESALTAVKTLDPNALVVNESPTVVQATDANGNALFQDDGVTPVYKALDDQFVPIDTFMPDMADVFSVLSPVEAEGEVPSLNNAINAVFNPYFSVASMNQYIDDQNTLHEKHGRLDKIKPLETNPPRRAIVLAKGMPALAKSLNATLEYAHKSCDKSSVCNTGDLQLVLLVVDADDATKDFYAALEAKENALAKVAFVPLNATAEEISTVLETLVQ